jgi:hypothetical protein
MIAVRLVREADASDDRIKETYRDIKESLRVSLVDAMFQAYATSPKFLDYVWRRFRPSMLAQPFVEQARKLTDLADAGVEGWAITDHAAALHSRNYGESDLRKLREIVELFHAVNPKLLIIANALRVALTGEPIGGSGVPHPPNHVDRDKLVRDFRGLQVPMADERESPLRVRTTFAEIQRTTGYSFVSTEYRAFGAYPDWLDVFWTDTRSLAVDVRRRDLCGRLERAAQDSARQLPYPLHVTAGDFADMIPINDVFCALLPGLIVDTAIARRGLGPEPQP